MEYLLAGSSLLSVGLAVSLAIVAARSASRGADLKIRTFQRDRAVDDRDRIARLRRDDRQILEAEIAALTDEKERLSDTILGASIPDTQSAREALLAEYRAQSRRLLVEGRRSGDPDRPD